MIHILECPQQRQVVQALHGADEVVRQVQRLQLGQGRQALDLRGQGGAGQAGACRVAGNTWHARGTAWGRVPR